MAGFHRFSDQKQIETGRLLFGELGCVSCHDGGRLNDQLAPKAAPNLKDVAQRSNLDFLAEYIASPNRVHSGTTMPNVLGEEEDDEKAIAITQYLLSLAREPFKRTSPDKVAIERGRELYGKVGCVACHVANPGEDNEESFSESSRPFPDLVAKYSIDGLRTFLRDPLHVRASGRMPSLRLSDNESRDIANYLLRETQIDGPLAYEVFTGRRRDLNDPGERIAYQTGLIEGFQMPDRLPRSRFSVNYSGHLKIDTAGEYTFHWQSSGALRFVVNGVVVAERTRAPERDRLHTGMKMVDLPAGWSPIQLEYFEPRGTKKLEITWAGAGFKKTPIPPTQLRHEKLGIERTSQEPWRLDSRLADAGKSLFASEGCVNCHGKGLDISGESKRSKPVTELDATKGCLSNTPNGVPIYHLSGTQREAVRRFVVAAKAKQFDPPSREVLITRNLTRLNCYACHERQSLGGITEAREPHFTCNEKDLGGEGRFPPTLTAIGYKLQLDWLSNVVENGASVRPYMNTRMPRFGGGNVRDLAKHFSQADEKADRFAASPDPPDQAKKIGRQLTGKGKLQCISCHKFNNHDSAGLQAMDLVTTTRRLNRQWFHEYMLNPASLRPGTRMPQSWPGGESFYKDIFDGDTNRQIESIWTYLSDGELAINPDGLVPKNKELVVAGKAVVYRNKLWEAGFRGIAVGYPAHVNMAFDAQKKRLALLWKNRFLNVTAHWSSQSMGRIRPAGTDVIQLPNGPPFAQLSRPDQPWPTDSESRLQLQFRGYQLDDSDRPTFLYRVTGDKRVIEVEDFANGFRDGNTFVLDRNVVLRGELKSKSLGFLIWDGQSVVQRDEGYQCDERLTVKLTLPEHVRAVDSGGQLRLLIDGDQALTKLGVQYRW